MERTLPWSWSFDPEILRLEHERIFRPSWQYVGHGAAHVDGPVREALA